jgi:hypothetical protein
MNKYPMETTEYVTIPIKVNRVAVTTNIEYSVVPYANIQVKPRPDVWVPAVVVDNEPKWLLTPQATPGKLQVWARVTDQPEIPVIDCGYISIF